MKKPSLIQITAILMVGVFLYSILGQWGTLSHFDRLSSDAKSVGSFFVYILMVLSICGIIGGVGLYFYKSWSRSLAIGIAAIFLLLSLPSLLRIAVPDGRFRPFDISSTIHVLFGLWCLYCLNRSDVKAKFGKQNQLAMPSPSHEAIAAPNIIEAPKIEKVASGQKLIIYAVLINILTACLQAAFGEMAGLVSIIAIIVSFMGLFRLFAGLSFSVANKVFFIVFILIPFINIIPLLMLNSSATKVLRNAGYHVGLLGARRLN